MVGWTVVPETCCVRSRQGGDECWARSELRVYASPYVSVVFCCNSNALFKVYGGGGGGGDGERGGNRAAASETSDTRTLRSQICRQSPGRVTRTRTTSPSA